MGTDPAPPPAKSRRFYSLNFNSTAGRVALVLSGLFILGTVLFSLDPAVAQGFGIDRETAVKLMGLPLLTYSFLHGSPEHLIYNLLFLVVAADFLESTFTSRQLRLLVILAIAVTGLGASVLFSTPLIGGAHIDFAFMGSCVALGRRFGWDRLNRIGKFILVIFWMSGIGSVIATVSDLWAGRESLSLLFTISMLLGAALAWSWTRSGSILPGERIIALPGTAAAPPGTPPAPGGSSGAPRES